MAGGKAVDVERLFAVETEGAEKAADETVEGPGDET